MSERHLSNTVWAGKARRRGIWEGRRDGSSTFSVEFGFEEAAFKEETQGVIGRRVTSLKLQVKKDEWNEF